MAKHTRLLILSANPRDSSRLRLDEEVREITNGLQRSARRDDFEVKQVLAVRPVDARRAVLDFRPTIVHFSGHGAGDEGIAFEDDSGDTKLVDAEVLSGFFGLFSDTVECVVLNACFSTIQAAAISKSIKHVIGMRREIGDRAAIEFSIAFYDALSSGRPVDFAYRLALNAIAWAGLREQNTPIYLSSPATSSRQTSPAAIATPIYLTPKLPCILVLDVSGSMAGEPIQLLTLALYRFVSDLASDPHAAERVDLALVTFGDNVSIARDFVGVNEFVVPELLAGGATQTGEALALAMDMLSSRKAMYRESGIAYYRPIVLLVTDGVPSDDINLVAGRLHTEYARKSLSFVAVGMRDADIAALKRIAPPDRPPVMLQELRFGDLFMWLSSSMSFVAADEPSKQPFRLPIPPDWGAT